MFSRRSFLVALIAAAATPLVALTPDEAEARSWPPAAAAAAS